MNNICLTFKRIISLSIQVLSPILGRCQWHHIFRIHNVDWFDRCRCELNGQKCKIWQISFAFDHFNWKLNFDIFQFVYSKWTHRHQIMTSCFLLNVTLLWPLAWVRRLFPQKWATKCRKWWAITRIYLFFALLVTKRNNSSEMLLWH